MTRFVASGPVRLAVEERGDGPPIVLVHGLSSNLRIWDAVAEQLAGRFRVVAYDQRHHGLSDDADDYSWEALSGDLSRIVDELGLKDPVVVGHSWGASVALQYAAIRPVRGVVCVDGGVLDLQGFGMSWDHTESMLTPPELEGPPEELFERIRREQGPIPWDRLEPVARRSFPVGPDGIARRRLPIQRHMRIVRHLWEQRPAELYARVTAPVLAVLAGGRPELDERERGFVEVKREGARRLLERYPHLRIEWLPSVHDVPLLHPDELAELVEAFSADGG